MGVFQNHLMAAAAASTATAADFYEYQIANSIRFDGSSSVLTKTWGSAGTSDKKFAISVWVKGHKTDGTWEIIASCAQSNLMALGVGARYDSDAHAIMYYTGNGGNNAASLALGRDVSAWRHIVMIYDSSQSTGADRIKIYNNGEHWTTGSTTYWGDIDGNGYPSQDTDSGWGMNGNANEIGRYQYNGDADYSGYMADFISIDGAASISDFGETKDGVWVPKDPSGLTFGNNGFWLNFASSGDLGNDVSGNNNDWTTAGLAASDQMLDSPTFNSTDNGGNFCTLNPLTDAVNMTLSEGNLTWTTSTSNRSINANFKLPAGTGQKCYWEHRMASWAASESDDCYLGINVIQPDWDSSSTRGGGNTGNSYGAQGYKNALGTDTTSYGAQIDTGDVWGVAVDLENNTIQFYKEGSAQGAAWSISGTTEWYPWIGSGGGSSSASGTFNFGQNGTFNGTETAGDNADANGYGNFYSTVPTGFKALCTANLPTPAADPEEEEGPYKYFVPKLYTGTGSSNAITGVGFQPDLVWISQRSSTEDPSFYDSSRGVTKRIKSSGSEAESTVAAGFTAFGSDGFTVGSATENNASSQTYVAWCWKGNGGTTASNTTGGITSTVQVDTDRGISLVQYTGTESAATIGHSLGAKPELIMVKCRSFDRSWAVQWVDVNNTTSYILNTDGSDASSGYWNNTSPTSTVFSVGGGTETNKDTKTFVAYCFVSKEGFSRIGTYEGNGNADGTFVYTGFRPAWIMTRSVDSTSDWQIFDDQREGYNVDNDELHANDGDAEGTSDLIDILSNGFKLRTSSDPNVAETYGYIAFAKNPFKYATAR